MQNPKAKPKVYRPAPVKVEATYKTEVQPA
ncbi:MAG: hypothetical protein JWR87_170 [Segetibacter sp.]|jgi:hypothetical protein|nr:hypothetical protein [Segetibacter sp.]